MNCQSFESIVNDLARAQMLETNMRKQALAHSQECHSCGLRLQGERLLTQGLQELAAETESVETPGRIEENLRAAFRNNEFAEPRRVARPRRWQWLTAAAVLLIVCSLAALHLRRTPPLAQVPKPDKIDGAGTGFGSAISVVAASPGSLLKKTTATTAASKRKASLRVLHDRSSDDSDKNVAAKETETTVAENTKREIATDFLPVGYPSSINFQEGGQIVRVELPRSTLATFGLPVNMDRYHEKVKADVLFGADGQARAIRFVQ
jgi:hypothetical protein